MPGAHPNPRATAGPLCRFLNASGPRGLDPRDPRQRTERTRPQSPRQAEKDGSASAPPFSPHVWLRDSRSANLLDPHKSEPSGRSACRLLLSIPYLLWRTLWPWARRSGTLLMWLVKGRVRWKQTTRCWLFLSRGVHGGGCWPPPPPPFSHTSATHPLGCHACAHHAETKSVKVNMFKPKAHVDMLFDLGPFCFAPIEGLPRGRRRRVDCVTVRYRFRQGWQCILRCINKLLIIIIIIVIMIMMMIMVMLCMNML